MGCISTQGCPPTSLKLKRKGKIKREPREKLKLMNKKVK